MLICFFQHFPETLFSVTFSAPTSPPCHLLAILRACTLRFAPGQEVCFRLLRRQEVERGTLRLKDALAKGGQKPEWMRWATSINVYFCFTPFQLLPYKQTPKCFFPLQD